MTDDVPDPPEGLLVGGQRLWRATLGEFDLHEHERVILLEACRTIDTLDALQALVDAEGVTLPWGDGSRANPAVVEARQHRVTLARLVASLGIPADDESGQREQRRGGARGVYRLGGVA